MSNSEINALENVVSTIFLPELCNSFFTFFEFSILKTTSFVGIDLCATKRNKKSIKT